MIKRAFVAALFCSVFSVPALAQYGGAGMQQVAGTYRVVSVVQTMADGSKVDVFGKTPLGTTILTSDGHFSVVFMRDDLPAFKSGIRVQGTPEENTSVVQGSLAYSGSYTVEGDVLSMAVKASTFPAWTGQLQKRKFTLKGDQLEWVGITGTPGANVVATLKRVK